MARAWYVAGTRDGRFGLLLGPFRSESSAAARVVDVRRTLRKFATHVAGFDPASIEVLSLGRPEIGIDFPPGQLNAKGYLSLDEG